MVGRDLATDSYASHTVPVMRSRVARGVPEDSPIAIDPRERARPATRVRTMTDAERTTETSRGRSRRNARRGRFRYQPRGSLLARRAVARPDACSGGVERARGVRGQYQCAPFFSRASGKRTVARCELRRTERPGG